MFDLAIPVAPTDHAIGPSHAQLTLVEYGDFECPNCKQAAPVVKLLLSHFSDRLRFVYRHFPLKEVHPHALDAALAAECAGGQGKFWAMHDLLFEQQSALSLDHLQAYAQRLELDVTRFSAEMSDAAYLQRIREPRRVEQRAECARRRPSLSTASCATFHSESRDSMTRSKGRRN